MVSYNLLPIYLAELRDGYIKSLFYMFFDYPEIKRTLIPLYRSHSVMFWPPRLATLRNVAERCHNVSKRGTTWRVRLQ